MALTTGVWNVVLAGHWNLAILSPKWISQTLFRLPDETPIEVLVAIDGVSPIKVKCEDVTIVPTENRIVIEPSISTPVELQKALELAQRVLEELPKTPVQAIGINFRFHAVDATEGFREVLSSEADHRIIDIPLRIRARSLSRQITHKNGTLNLQVEVDEHSKYSVLFNFDLKSDKAEEQLNWLQQSTNDLWSLVQRIVTEYLQESVEGINDNG